MDIGSFFMGIAIGYILCLGIRKIVGKRKVHEYYQCTACGKPIIEPHRPALCPHCKASKKIVRASIICTPIAEEARPKKKH